jgi:hypothetical protein
MINSKKIHKFSTFLIKRGILRKFNNLILNLIRKDKLNKNFAKELFEKHCLNWYHYE